MAGMTAKMMMAAGMGGAVAFLTMAAAGPRERAIAAPPAPAAATPGSPEQPVAALEQMKPGLWVVTRDDPGASPARLCIEDAARLVQLAHGDDTCRRMTVSDGAKAATVQYRCGARGWGRTEIKIDAAETVRVDTQGILDNAPFAWRATARREGECPA